ncbi:MAG: hypothetical protein AAF674_08385 [Pseudomonadota bacterium]
MTRGWFLAGLIAQAAVCFVALAIFGLWEQRYDTLNSPVLETRVATLMGFHLATWFLIFPVLRLMLRRRLTRRARPLWWAGAPGLLAFASVIMVGGVFLLQVFGIHIGDSPKPVRRLAIVIALGPAPIGALIAVALIIECLRPDRLHDPTDVFD